MVRFSLAPTCLPSFVLTTWSVVPFASAFVGCAKRTTSERKMPRNGSQPPSGAASGSCWATSANDTSHFPFHTADACAHRHEACLSSKGARERVTRLVALTAARAFRKLHYRIEGVFDVPVAKRMDRQSEVLQRLRTQQLKRLQLSTAAHGLPLRRSADLCRLGLVGRLSLSSSAVAFLNVASSLSNSDVAMRWIVGRKQCV